MRISRDDLFAGGLFVVLGLFFALEALNYDLGTPFRMGPGFLPLVLGCTLVALGLAVAGKGLRRPADAPKNPVPWRAIGLITLSVLFFALTVRGLGFVPVVFVSVLITAFASTSTRLPGALAIALGLTLLSTLVFVIGLRMQVPMVGPWLPFGG